MYNIFQFLESMIGICWIRIYIYIFYVSHNDILDNELETVIVQVSLSCFRQATGNGLIIMGN